MHRAIHTAWLLAILLAPAAPAAIVTYDMDLSVPGEFKIFASASVGDNLGLAAYVVPLTAETTSMITSFEHVSPFASTATNADGHVGPAGFTVLRSSYTGLGGGLTFFGSQDVIGGTPHLIHGFGQQAGSFSDLGIMPMSSAETLSWGDAVLIARGTYVGDANDFLIDTRSADLVANVFGEGIHSPQAEVHITGSNGFSYIPQPEPPPPAIPEPPPPEPEPVRPPVVVEPPPASDPPPVEPPVVDPPPADEPPTQSPIVHPGSDDGPLVWPPGERGDYVVIDESVPWNLLIYTTATRQFVLDVDANFIPGGAPIATGFRNGSSAILSQYTGDRAAALAAMSFDNAQQAAGTAHAPEPSSLVLGAFATAALAAFGRRPRTIRG